MTTLKNYVTQNKSPDDGWPKPNYCINRLLAICFQAFCIGLTLTEGNTCGFQFFKTELLCAILALKQC